MVFLRSLGHFPSHIAAKDKSLIKLLDLGLVLQILASHCERG